MKYIWIIRRHLKNIQGCLKVFLCIIPMLKYQSNLVSNTISVLPPCYFSGCFLPRCYERGYYSNPYGLLRAWNSVQYSRTASGIKIWPSIWLIHGSHIDIYRLSILLCFDLSWRDDGRKQCSTYPLVLDDPHWASIDWNGKSVFGMYSNKSEPRMV